MTFSALSLLKVRCTTGNFDIAITVDKEVQAHELTILNILCMTGLTRTAESF